MDPAAKQDRVAEAIGKGQLWRAKEILSGRVGTSPFDAELYEQFGTLLLRMGDDLKPGDFSFSRGSAGQSISPP